MKPRLTMIAGPNGAGKTTFTRMLLREVEDVGFYINPDDIARDLAGSYADIRGSHTREAQQIADRLREKYILQRDSFCFETVMSHPSKIELLNSARAAGFETILYYVGLCSARLSIARVSSRVAQGEHGVPAEKIKARYQRSLELLPRAIGASDVAYIFDNSQSSGAQATNTVYPMIAYFRGGRMIRNRPTSDSGWFDSLGYSIE